jgi:hypothetical protein
MARQKLRLTREVFLSHSSKNRPFAFWLKNELQRNGVRSWYSEAHIVGAQQWHDEIGQALDRCDWFILILSPSSVQSKWVKRELLFALENDQFNKRIIPVIYRPCDMKLLSWTLSSMQQVDFTGNRATGLVDLLRIWGL